MAALDGCTTLERAPVPSDAALAFGLVVDEDGVVGCDPEAVSCGRIGPSDGMFVERLSRSCGFYGGIVRTRDQVWTRFPQSIGTHGGPGYYLAPIEDADPTTFEPLGGSMARDAHSVFDYGNRVPDLDPETFTATDPENGCRGCDATRCLVDCSDHPLTRPRFCWAPRPD